VDDDAAALDLSGGARMLKIAETVARARGAELCFGEPVREADRTIIPVASVSTAGGLGFGSVTGDEPSGGGGLGGMFGARPVGYIELTGGEARFRRILTAADVAQLLTAAAITARVLIRSYRNSRRS
jgi:uncharacterized spore protein YtfJ